MAKLTKDQVLFVEKYLIELGVKYWDVRIELIDHIVSEIEESITQDFEQTVVDAANKLGYKSYTINKRLGEKTKELGRKYNTVLKNKMKLFFVSKNTVVVAFIFITLFSILYKELTNTVFMKIGLGMFAIPIAIVLGVSISKFRTIKKSIHITRAYSLLSIPFGIFQIFFIIDIKLDVRGMLIFIIIPIYYYYTYCSYLVYKEVSAKYLKVYNELYAK